MERIGQNFYIEKQFNEQMKKLLLLLIFPIFTFAQEKATEKLELLDQASVWINNTIEIEKKINLKHNAITDKGLKLISVLENLEVINLIGTNITEKSLDIFEEFKSLKRVYLWESGIKNDQIDSFNQKQNKITLVGSLK